MNKIISGGDKRWEESQEVITGCKQADAKDSAGIGERGHLDWSSVLVFEERPEWLEEPATRGLGEEHSR